MAKTKKMALGGMGAAMGVRPQDTAPGQAAAMKLGQIRGRSNMPPSPSPAVKSPFVPPQTQRPAVQTPQQRDQQAQLQRPPPRGPVAPRGFGPPPGPNDSAKIAGLKSLLDGKPVSGLQPQAQQKPGVPDYAQPYVQNYQALQSRQAQQKPVGQTTASSPEQQALQQAHAYLKAQAQPQAQQTALPPTAGLKGTRVSADQTPSPMKKGGMVSSKPKASSASSRGDGIATKGKTKGRFV